MPPAACPGGPAASTGFFTITAGAAENPPGNLFFSYPAGRFLYALGRQLHRNLQKGGICSASGNHL